MPESKEETTLVLAEHTEKLLLNLEKCRITDIFVEVPSSKYYDLLNQGAFDSGEYKCIATEEGYLVPLILL